MTDREVILDMFTRAGFQPRELTHEIAVERGNDACVEQEVSLLFNADGSLLTWGCYVDDTAIAYG